MRYLLAILLPPVAVLITGRPISALINFFLWLCLIIPGVIHALFVVSQDAADERNRELMTAVSGKAIPRKSSGEVKVLTGSLVGITVGILIIAATAFVLTTFFPGAAIKLGAVEVPLTIPPQTAPAVEATPAPLPALEGWTLPEVTSKHGPPLTTDKSTGLATWPTFTAHFANGQVTTVQDRIGP
jgi:uncharacterized membrane protein YqaE (UPF0057 family)